MANNLGVVVVALALASSSLADRQQLVQDRSPSRVTSSQEIEGRFLGYCQGDYLHVGFQPKHAKAKWFFLWGRSPDDIAYFLATRRGEWMRVRYEVTDTFIPEAGGRQVIEVLVDATAGQTSYRAWYQREGRSIVGASREKFEKLVQSQVDSSNKSDEP